MARLNLAYTRITAPVSGRVGLRTVAFRSSAWVAAAQLSVPPGLGTAYSTDFFAPPPAGNATPAVLPSVPPLV